MRGCSRRQYSRGRRRGYLALLGLGIPLLLPSGTRDAAAAQRPRVLVVFEARTPQYPELGDTGLRARTAGKISQKCAKNWPFLAWSAVTETPPAPAADWVWEARVETESGGGGVTGGTARDQRVLLRHFVKPAGSTSSREIATHTPQLYDIGDPKPSEVADFESDLDLLIEEQFTDAFFKQVGKALVGKIALGDRIVADTSRQIVIIPLRRRELLAGAESELEAKFVNTGVTPPRVDTLRLKAARAVEQGDCMGCIYGPVLLFDSPPLSLTNPGYWDPSFPAVLASARNVRIFMFSYEEDNAAGDWTSEGVVLDADPGGGAP